MKWGGAPARMALAAFVAATAITASAGPVKIHIDDIITQAPQGATQGNRLGPMPDGLRLDTDEPPTPCTEAGMSAEADKVGGMTIRGNANYNVTCDGRVLTGTTVIQLHKLFVP